MNYFPLLIILELREFTATRCDGCCLWLFPHCQFLTFCSSVLFAIFLNVQMTLWQSHSAFDTTTFSSGAHTVSFLTSFFYDFFQCNAFETQKHAKCVHPVLQFTRSWGNGRWYCGNSSSSELLTLLCVSLESLPHGIFFRLLQLPGKLLPSMPAGGVSHCLAYTPGTHRSWQLPWRQQQMAGKLHQRGAIPSSVAFPPFTPLDGGCWLQCLPGELVRLWQAMEPAASNGRKAILPKGRFHPLAHGIFLLLLQLLAPMPARKIGQTTNEQPYSGWNLFSTSPATIYAI